VHNSASADVVLNRQQPSGRPHDKNLRLFGATMKKLATAIAVTALIETSAFAADMPVKAPPAPAVYNWTGWYVGVNAGASFGDVKTDFNVAPVTVTTSSTPITVPGAAGSDRAYPDGFMGGGQIGYNWQLSPIWVVGLEADFQGAVERDSSTINDPFTVVVAGNLSLVGTASAQYEAKISWFGTVRPRIGYVWGNGTVMSYVTGGLAYGRVGINGTSTVSGSFNIAPLDTFSVTHAIGHSQVNTGWVVGYGTEGVIDFWGARNWTWKIEGLYVDLGSVDDTDAIEAITGASGGQVNTHAHFTDGILRAGLNYKFY
jgi:outer membrane immunogenic protein